MSSPIFFAFAPAVDGLVPPAPVGLVAVAPRNIAVGDEVFYLAAVGSPDGQPLPAAQLETVTTRETRGRIETVTETVGRGMTRRFGKWEVKGVVATRTYTFDKFTKGAKKAALEAAIWRDAQGNAVAIWCKLVRLDTARELGFKVPKFHIGHNRRPGTRTTGREHNAEVTARETRTLETATAVEQVEGVAEGTQRAAVLELDAPAKPVAPVNEEPKFEPRKLDLD